MNPAAEVHNKKRRIHVDGIGPVELIQDQSDMYRWWIKGIVCVDDELLNFPRKDRDRILRPYLR